MSSTTPTRRVLGALDVNTPLAAKGSTTLAKGLKTSSPTKSQDMSKISSTVFFQPVSTDCSSALGEGKRNTTHVYIGSQDLSTGRSPKRQKKAASSCHAEGVLEQTEKEPSERSGGQKQSAVDSQGDATELQSPSTGTHVDVPIDEYRSASPSSSISSCQAGLHDSQNTVVTEPDNVPILRILSLPAPSASEIRTSRLSSETLRSKAKAMKLRLQLANYKVRTNQINIPISRLQIRSSPTTHRSNFSRSRINSSQPKNPPPAAAAAAHSPSRIPRINLQHPSAEKPSKHQFPIIEIPSSPPPYLRTRDGENAHEIVSTSASASTSPKKDLSPKKMFGEVSAPVVQSHRETGLNPPHLVFSDGDALTSSAVKGCAADGLLKLREIEMAGSPLGLE